MRLLAIIFSICCKAAFASKATLKQNLTDLGCFNASKTDLCSNATVLLLNNQTILDGLFENALRVPNVTLWNVAHVTSMGRMFRNASSFNQAIGNWDVSNVTSMFDMFAFASSFDKPLNWNVRSVTDMSRMFWNAVSFNQNISAWSVANVTSMYYMFFGATLFNQPLFDWDVGSVRDMAYMFFDARSFNQDINGWIVGSVTDMRGMFWNAVSFNQNINAWNVNKVTRMNYMFNNATLFNQPLFNWNVSSVTDMIGMFRYAESFNQSLSQWNVSNVVYMPRMFTGARAFDQHLDQWDVSKVQDMCLMFGHSTFNSWVNWTNTTSLQFTDFMFYSATLFNQQVNGWEVSGVKYMNSMFEGAQSFNKSLRNWDVRNVRLTNRMFMDALSFNQPLDSWNLTSTNTTRMFYNAESFNGLIFHPQNLREASWMFAHASKFNQDISHWNVSHAQTRGMLHNTISRKTHRQNYCSSANKNQWVHAGVYCPPETGGACVATGDVLNIADTFFAKTLQVDGNYDVRLHNEAKRPVRWTEPAYEQAVYGRVYLTPPFSFRIWQFTSSTPKSYIRKQSTLQETNSRAEQFTSSTPRIYWLGGVRNCPSYVEFVRHGPGDDENIEWSLCSKDAVGKQEFRTDAKYRYSLVLVMGDTSANNPSFFRMQCEKTEDKQNEEDADLEPTGLLLGLLSCVTFVFVLSLASFFASFFASAGKSTRAAGPPSASARESKRPALFQRHPVGRGLRLGIP